MVAKDSLMRLIGKEVRVHFMDDVVVTGVLEYREERAFDYRKPMFFRIEGIFRIRYFLPCDVFRVKLVEEN